MSNRFFVILTVLILALSAKAQLTLDKTYDYSLTSIKINQTDYKYFLMDVAKSECRIYNLDHSLWKNISITLTANYYLYDIKFVSRYLFNSDELVELWYSAYEYVSTGTSTGYYIYISKVINENGTVLASVTGGAYAYVIPAGTDVYKFLVYAYDNSVTPYIIKTYLYSLPNSSSAVDYLSELKGDPFPNPASDFINLPLGSESSSGILQVFGLTGQKIFEQNIRGESAFHLNTRNWSSGIYTYRLLKNGKPSEAKEFIVR
jgi:Secretion system C-terminal sorting domain